MYAETPDSFELKSARQRFEHLWLNYYSRSGDRQVGDRCLTSPTPADKMRGPNFWFNIFPARRS